MKLVNNAESNRVFDLIHPLLGSETQLDVATPALSVFAFAELIAENHRLAGLRLLLPAEVSTLDLLGTIADRPARNRLQTRWLASRVRRSLAEEAAIRFAAGLVPQGMFVVRQGPAEPVLGVLRSVAFTTEGLGLTPGNPLSLIQASETPEEARLAAQWFDSQWSALSDDVRHTEMLIATLQEIVSHRDPFLVYALVLHHL